MLQWTAGAKPGKAFKRKRTDDDVTEQKKKYEVTRTRGFKPHWKNDRQWLQFDEKSSVMVCTYCKDNNKSNNFAKGTSNFRLEAIQAHENSQQHKTASLVSTRPAAEKSEAAKAVVKLKAHEYDRMNVLFRNAHAIAKHHLAFKFYPILCQLDKAKGLDVGETYLNDKKAREFVHHIANVSRSQVNELLDASKFISVTCDGTSDFMGDEYESLYVRTSISGKVTDSFFCLGTAESACALDIFSFIKSTFEREDRTSNTDLWTKIVGFGSDGASNMQGKRSGVAAHLREENPEIVIIHCLAHRLELAFKDAIKQIGNRLYEKTTTLLLGLYYFYRKGPKQKKMLKKTFKLLAMSRIMPTRIGGTRWLPHMQRAIGSFIKGYTAIKTQLETASHDNAKAEGLAKIMGDVAVITFIIILKEIISPLNKLSLALQRKDTSLADSVNRIISVTDSLKKLKLQLNEEADAIATSKLYQGTTLKGRTPSVSYRNNLIDKLIDSLDKRFPSTDIVVASAISSFKNWPCPEDKEAIIEQGDHEIHLIKSLLPQTLTKAGVELSEISTEWSVLKSLIYQRFSSKVDDGSLKWYDVFRMFKDDTSNIATVIDLLLTFPPTSVNNETTFSRTKLTKGKRRGHLKTDTLSDLVQIELETPDISSFDPKASIDDWMVTPSGRKRRVGYTVRGNTTKVPEEAAAQIDLDDEEAEPATNAIQTNLNQERSTMMMIRNIDDVSSDEEEDSDDDDDNEMAEDEVFLIKLKQLLKDYEE